MMPYNFYFQSSLNTERQIAISKWFDSLNDEQRSYIQDIIEDSKLQEYYDNDPDS